MLNVSAAPFHRPGDLTLCPKCGGQMKIVAFLTDYQAINRIIDH